MKSEFIYSKDYDISMYGIEKLHPFDGKKYSRAWELFNASDAAKKSNLTLHDQVASEEFLDIVHAKSYLHSLDTSNAVADVIEIGLARLLPSSTLQNKLLKPAKAATYGTWLATQIALKDKKIAMNFGGGYHHAFPDHGEGFCFYADAALAIHHAREIGLLTTTDQILMIDLDAHRGNGFEACFKQDDAVKIFDMYNFQTYPGMHSGDIKDFPFMVPLRAGMIGEEYLEAMQEELPPFLEASQQPKLAFYNAGTDILEGDPLGGLKVSFDQVIERDRFVIQQLVERNIPTVVMTSGGYTKDSYKLIAKLAENIAGICD